MFLATSPLRARNISFICLALTVVAVALLALTKEPVKDTIFFLLFATFQMTSIAYWAAYRNLSRRAS